MISLFNYSTLKVELVFKTKSLSIQLNRPNKLNAINTRMINELDDILTWCASHMEVQSILLKGHENFFCCGLDLEEFKEYNHVQVKEFFEKFQKIIFGMNHLPQTIIVDASKECHNLASELMLGADLRIAHDQASISFNHLEKGITPQSGGISLLQKLVNPTMAKNWILTGLAIDIDVMCSSGFLVGSYKKSSSSMKYMEIIHKQAHLSRIQSKAALFECQREDLSNCLTIETEYSQASQWAQDWNNEKFTNPIEFFSKNKSKSNQMSAN